jgi:hypothetical protein
MNMMPNPLLLRTGRQRLATESRHDFCGVTTAYRSSKKLALSLTFNLKSVCQLDHRSAGANVKCYRFRESGESFSTECLSLSTMLAVIGQIEVMRCFTARIWVPKRAGHG